jgi:hypothetical protein
MNRLLQAASIAILVGCTGCGSMLANQKPLELTSNPTGASFQTSWGFTGVTPAQVTPPSYKKDIVVTFTHEGYEPRIMTAETRVSNWTIGNLPMFGLLGILGMFIDASSEQAFILKEPVLFCDFEAPPTPPEEEGEDG